MTEPSDVQAGTDTQTEPPARRDWVTTEFIKEGARPQTRETREVEPNE